MNMYDPLFGGLFVDVGIARDVEGTEFTCRSRTGVIGRGNVVLER
jgi:hypothetical protein